ncbi:hypothetical protein ACFU74_27650, partial [Kitasatospora sp. NPDC057500]
LQGGEPTRKARSRAPSCARVRVCVRMQPCPRHPRDLHPPAAPGPAPPRPRRRCHRPAHPRRHWPSPHAARHDRPRRLHERRDVRRHRHHRRRRPLADGTLIEIKSTRHPHRFEKATAWQILGYLLLDTTDHHRIDTVGLYLTRTATLATWPVEDYLALLGVRCRDLTRLRATFAGLLTGCPADQEPLEPDEQRRVQRLLDRLATPIPLSHCLACAQTVPPLVSVGRARRYCTTWCTRRARGLRQRGWLPDLLPDLAVAA